MFPYAFDDACRSPPVLNHEPTHPKPHGVYVCGTVSAVFCTAFFVSQVYVSLARLSSVPITQANVLNVLNDPIYVTDSFLVVLNETQQTLSFKPYSAFVVSHPLGFWQLLLFTHWVYRYLKFQKKNREIKVLHKKNSGP